MEYKTSITNEGDDIIYMNITGLNTSNLNLRAELNVSRTSTILENTENYLLSIIKFRIPTNTFPLFFFPDYPLIVTLESLGSIASVPLVFIQTDFTELADIYINGIYSYQVFAVMINNAIIQANTHMAFPLVSLPFIAYNTQSATYEISYPASFQTDLANSPHLYFNTDLNWYFQSFPVLTNINQSPKDNQLLVLKTNNNNIIMPDNSAGLIMRQEYNTISLDNSLTNIAITSNNLPVIPVGIATSFLSYGGSSNSTAISIIEDFDPSNIAGSQRSYQQYTSQNNRYSTLLHKTSMYNVNLGFYTYSQEKNKYFEIFIAPHFTISIKLMFKRKNLNY